MCMHSAELVLGQACKTYPTSGQSMAFGVCVLSYCGSFLAGSNHCRYEWLYTYLPTHTYLYFRKEPAGGWGHSMDQWQWYHSQSGPLAFASTLCNSLSHNLPSPCLAANPSPTLTRCAPFLSASCWGAPPPSFWVATIQPVKPHFLFICLSSNLCLFRH